MVRCMSKRRKTRSRGKRTRGINRKTNKARRILPP